MMMVVVVVRESLTCGQKNIGRNNTLLGRDPGTGSSTLLGRDPGRPGAGLHHGGAIVLCQLAALSLSRLPDQACLVGSAGCTSP